jgi:O-antigen ligase
MSNEQVTLLVAATCGVLGIAAWIGLLVVPTWQAYSSVWQRLAASFLTLYVVAAMVGVGVAGAAGVVWFWDRL